MTQKSHAVQGVVNSDLPLAKLVDSPHESMFNFIRARGPVKMR
jgi:hypothetical protein